MIGSTVAQYRITKKLGAGGMGVVYQAEDRRLNRLVALKFLREGSLDPILKQRFLEEARSAASLQHPNVCPIFDVGEEDGQLYIAMAYLEGETLAEKIRRGPLETDTALELGLQIAEGLAAAHAKGIVHRDIKSSNVLVTGEGHAYILDFGLALRQGSERLTRDGRKVGTPAYMPPEQIEGKASDSRVDVWALGVVLYEMLTGRLPFHKPDELAMMHAIVHEEPPAVGSMRPDVGPEFEAAIMKALRKDPRQRWQTARELADWLRPAKTGSRAETFDDRTLTIGPVGPQPVSRRRLLAALVLPPVIGAAAYVGSRRWRQNALPEEKRIAVLPFEVIGHDENLAALASGLVEALTAKLSEMALPRNTLIIPASEVRDRKIASAAQAKRIYGANLVVTGSAQLLEKVAQFTLTLVDADTLRQAGARTLDLDLNQPLKVRDELLSALLSLLQLQGSQAGGAPMDSLVPGAYAEYLKGSGYLARYDQPGNVERALASFQSALQLDPKYPLARAGLARAYMWKADETGEQQWSRLAIKEGRQAAADGPGMAATHAALGRIYGTFGMEEAAVGAFQQALQIAPGDGEVLRDLADVLANLGRFTEAEAMFTQSVKQRPGDWYGHLMFGLFFVRRSRMAEAEKEFGKALELTPQNGIVRRNLAGLYRMEGKYDDAEKQLRIAIADEPTASLYSALGVVLYYRHKFPEAAAALEKALDKDPSRYIFWGNLGMIYQEMGSKPSEAEHALRRAIDLGERYGKVEARDYNTFANLAEYYGRLKDTAAAEAQLAKIPDAVRERFLLHLALIYELIGQRGKAVECVVAVPDPSTLSDVKNDPSLNGLWRDASLQQKLHQKWKQLPG